VTADEEQGFIVAYYNASFTMEPSGVTVKVVFDTGSAHQVAGLWFSSPKLNSD
jgi:hypothetical protein